MAGILLRIGVDGQLWSYDRIADEWIEIQRRLLGPSRAGMWSDNTSTPRDGGGVTSSRLSGGRSHRAHTSCTATDGRSRCCPSGSKVVEPGDLRSTSVGSAAIPRRSRRARRARYRGACRSDRRDAAMPYDGSACRTRYPCSAGRPGSGAYGPVDHRRHRDRSIRAECPSTPTRQVPHPRARMRTVARHPETLRHPVSCESRPGSLDRNDASRPGGISTGLQRKSIAADTAVTHAAVAAAREPGPANPRDHRSDHAQNRQGCGPRHRRLALPRPLRRIDAAGGQGLSVTIGSGGMDGFPDGLSG